jgi:hypothetical protein
VSAQLQPAAGQEPFWQVHASGFQVYQCALKTDAPATWGWKLTGPEATLTNASGAAVGRHFAGPSWAGNDGATVVGKVVASAPAAQPGAVAWLLLTITSREGQGLLTPTTSVQRLQTQGGSAPQGGCDADHASGVARVPYTATYVFWRAKAAAAG